MTVESLAETKWLFNDTIDFSTIPFGTNFIIAFASNKKQYGKMRQTVYYRGGIEYRTLKYEGLTSVDAFDQRVGWDSEAYKTVVIAGGEYEDNADLIAFFEANATQIPLYTLQEKEINPTTDNQEITPDAGFDGLSKVTVKAIADDNLIPENIKHDVELFGVVGTYSGFDDTDPLAVMTNLAGSGQDDFVKDWATMAKTLLYEQGVSNTYLNSDKAKFLIAKAVTDLIEDGNLSNTTLSMVGTLRVNHPHSEDDNV